MADRAAPGVSFVVPLHQGAETLAACLDAILAQRHPGPLELIVVDDGGDDGSPAILARYAGDPRVRIVRGDGRGAAAALNRGLEIARHPLLAQVDQDVVLEEGWLERLVEALDDPRVAAAQGVYHAPAGASFWVRLAGLDLAWRYRHRREGGAVDHVCTGNTVFRAAALREIGGFDSRLGYGYDNDVSYRLADRGHRLVRLDDARSLHYWPSTLAGYVGQQYGQGYGRVDLVAKHPRRVGGDDVSGPLMMAHAPLTAAALGGFLLAMVVAADGGPWEIASLVALAVLLALALERAWTGALMFRATGDRAALALPLAHLVRDVCWSAAIADWCVRRVLRVPGEARWSMPRRRLTPGLPRTAGASAVGGVRGAAGAGDVMIVVPVHNEAETIALVVAELRAACPHAGLLVVDDASSDATPSVLDRLGVRHLRLPQHLGLGSAMRVGLRQAAWLGYRMVVRVDGDGQHDPADVERLLEPIRRGQYDAVRGSRYLGGGGDRAQGFRRVGQRALAAALGALTRRPVTDPTSGFWAFGPRALALLAEHHPTDYPEPELSLFLHRNAMVAQEVAVTMRPRRHGSSSFTFRRGLVTSGRVALAMIVVPWRAPVEVGARD